MQAGFLFSDFERHNHIIQKLDVSDQMGDFFGYIGSWVINEPKSGVWYMCFYRSIIGMAAFRKPKELE